MKCRFRRPYPSGVASQTDICNIAAMLLGCSPVVAITDQSVQARAFNAVWNAERDSELRKHLWRFSITRIQLPQSATPPVNGPYNIQYALPDDCLRVLAVGDFNFNYPGVDLSEYRSEPTNDDYLRRPLVRARHRSSVFSET
jgi:hypothetical protein